MSFSLPTDPTTYWNETAGPKWVALQEPLDRLLHPLGMRALERADVRPGERVLDVGCGCGDTVLDLAQRVGPEGLVLGVDVCACMLERARQRVKGLGSQVRLQQADAHTARWDEEPFDAVFSRFGVMFFEQPVDAFANLRQALRPAGRMHFVCWQPVSQNPLFQLALTAASEWLPLPTPSPPHQPGPFSQAPAGRARQIVEQAGFREVDCQASEDLISVGGLSETVEILLKMGPIVPLLAEAEPALCRAVAERLSQLLDPLNRPQGVQLMARTWMVSAFA